MELTAAVNITAGQVVYVSSANSVSPAATANRSACVGVAKNTVSAGGTVQVIVLGRATVTADGAINAGDAVAAAATAGRVVALNTHSHLFTPSGSISPVSAGTPTGSNSPEASHTHGFTPSGGLSSDSAGTPSGTVASHRHEFGTRVDGFHTHGIGLATTGTFMTGVSISSDSAGTPSGSISTESAHIHLIGYTGSGTVTEVGNLSLVDSSGIIRAHANVDTTTAYNLYTAATSHTHTFTGNALPTHTHTLTPTTALAVTSIPTVTWLSDLMQSVSPAFTGNALGTHSHTFTGTAGTTGAGSSHTHTFTGSALPTHSHTFTGSAGTTGTEPNAEIVGKALTSAVGAGQTLDILVN